MDFNFVWCFNIKIKSKKCRDYKAAFTAHCVALWEKKLKYFNF